MANVQFSVPAPAQDRTKAYQQFKGADFSNDATQVDDSRSPWPLNLISDAGGYPEKRPGWRTVVQLPGRVNGLFHLETESGTHLLAHAGDKLLKWDEAGGSATLTSGLADARSTGFVSGGRLYLLTGAQYVVYGKFDGAYAVKRVTDIAYTPTTYISRKPTGGGEFFESVNLLSKRRKNDFLADGTAKDYYLDGAPIDADPLTVVANGETLAEGTGYTVDRAKGVVKFLTAPKKPEAAGGVAGADNVFVTYARTVEGYAQRIEQCTVCARFGAGTADRTFFSGNPNYKNQDWHSGHADPTYVPDLSYAIIGGEESAIKGYLHVSDYLAVVKEDNQQDATVFIRTTEVDADGDVKFRVRQGVQSVGAVSKYCFASLRDDPLFLSRAGVYAVATVTVTLERTVRPRSRLVDTRLTAEPGLEEAVACVWGHWFLVCVNGHCYVADSRQQSHVSSLADNYGYEWYYWENVPARVLMERGETLFFGTADGRICRFNTDRDKMDRYSDDGAAIVAEWATKSDDDGDFMRFKTMTRRGSGVLLKPYTASSIKIIVQTDRDFGVEVRRSGAGIFNFEDFDFETLDFNTFETPRSIAINKKVKKYKTMQFIVRNDRPREGFGIFGIIKRFRIGNYVK